MVNLRIEEMNHDLVIYSLVHSFLVLSIASFVVLLSLTRLIFLVGSDYIEGRVAILSRRCFLQVL